MEKVAITSAADKGFIAVLLVLVLFAIGWGVRWFVNRGLKREEETVKMLLEAEKENSKLFTENVTNEFKEGINKIVERLENKESISQRIQQERLENEKQWNEDRTKREEKIISSLNSLADGFRNLEVTVRDNIRRIDLLEKG